MCPMTFSIMIDDLCLNSRTLLFADNTTSATTTGTNHLALRVEDVHLLNRSRKSVICKSSEAQ